MRILACALVICTAAGVPPVAAEGPQMGLPSAQACRADGQQVALLLRERYGEYPRASATMAGQDGALSLFATPDGRRWTITLTRPSGETCLVASGMRPLPPAEGRRGVLL